MLYIKAICGNISFKSKLKQDEYCFLAEGLIESLEESDYTESVKRLEKAGLALVAKDYDTLVAFAHVPMSQRAAETLPSLNPQDGEEVVKTIDYKTSKPIQTDEEKAAAAQTKAEAEAKAAAEEKAAAEAKAKVAAEIELKAKQDAEAKAAAEKAQSQAQIQNEAAAKEAAEKK